MRCDHALALEASGRVIEDRAAVIEHREALVMVIADGAGGSGNGAQGSLAVVEGFAAFLDDRPPLDSKIVWTTWLAELDATMSRAPSFGESTAVVLALTSGQITGASVGDSEAWFLPEGDSTWLDLTNAQRRKPLLGSGAARPVGFTIAHPGGTLLVATDGLFKYANLSRLRAAIVAGQPLATTCQTLINLARLPNQTLQDDVALILARIAP